MIEGNTFIQLLLDNTPTKQYNTLKVSILGGGITLYIIHSTFLFTIRPDAFTKASGGFVVPYAEAIRAFSASQYRNDYKNHIGTMEGHIGKCPDTGSKEDELFFY